MVSKFGGSRPRPEKGEFPVIFFAGRNGSPRPGRSLAFGDYARLGMTGDPLDRISCFFYFSGFVLFHQEMMMLCIFG